MLGGLIWVGLLAAYITHVPRNAPECNVKSVGDQLMSWITFTVSVVLFLTLTVVAAGRLRVNRACTVGFTAILMLPLVLFFALLLYIINFCPFQTD